MLASQFAIAARQYADTASELATLGKSGPDYTRLRELTIQAQTQTEAAFRAFTGHVTSHQCGGAATSSQIQSGDASWPDSK